MKYSLILVALFTVSIHMATGQVSGDYKAKIYFNEAQKLFNQNDYKEALNYLVKAEQSLQGTNGLILSLKVKILYNTSRFIEAENALNLFINEYSNQVTDQVRSSTLDYFIRIEKAAKSQRARENEKLLALQKKREQEKKYKAIALKKEPQIQKKLNQFLSLEEGKPYLLTYRSKLTTSPNEKAIFIFYGNKYLLYTIPSATLAYRLNKDKIYFGSSNAAHFSHVAHIKVKRHGKKREISYKKSIHYSNVFIGGDGDEMLWTGRQNSVFSRSLFYYYYLNTLHCDVKMKNSFSSSYYNPYIETGNLRKTVDYNAIQDSKLAARLKSAGVQHKSNSDRSHPEGLKITIVPSGKVNMVLPLKKITYQFEDKIKGEYVQNGSRQKKEFLSYIPKSRTNHYAYIQYSKYQPKSDLFRSIASLKNNNYKMSQSLFTNIYNTFDDNVGSGYYKYFKNTEYKLFFDIIPQLYKGEKEALF
ncbi:MAG: hypothetical protein JXR71_06795 [Bacteroidales bacterium]|nr:hypothetical protein [Bacteroidales bacterium]